MSDLPTPETDAAIEADSYLYQILYPSRKERPVRSSRMARLERQRDELLEALEAAERREWAVRNLEAVSDPLPHQLLALRREVERTTSEANVLRRAAIAKAKGGDQ